MKCTINLVLKEQFQEYFDQDLDKYAFRGNIKTKLIYKQNILLLILRLVYFTGSNGILELSIGEIVNASSTTKDELEEYTYKLKTSGIQYGYGLKPEQLITVTAMIRGTNESTKWILSVGDFLPFLSDPGFRSQLQENKSEGTFASNHLYTSMAFWMLDNSMAANFIHNISNYPTKKVKEMFNIQELSDVFLDADAERNIAEPNEKKGLSLEERTTLSLIFERGDLCWAPSPFISTFSHNVTGADLTLLILDKMKVIKLYQ